MSHLVRQHPSTPTGAWTTLGLLGLLALAPSCGSGTATLFASASDDNGPSAAPFEINFENTMPRLWPSPGDARVAGRESANGTAIRIPFRVEIDGSTFQATDFLVERLDSMGGREDVEVGALLKSGSSVDLLFSEAFALDGLYRVELRDLGVRDTNGRGLSGSRLGYFKVESGAYSEDVQSVAFGATSVGGLAMGPGNRAFASLEANFSFQYFIVGASAAPRGGNWSSPNFLYQSPFGNFFEISTGGIALNQTLATVPIQQGRYENVHSEDSIRIKAFPGRIGSNGDLIWPGTTNGATEPDRYVVDRAAPGSALEGRHLAYRGTQYWPVDPSQLQGSNGQHVAAFWAFTDESGNDFEAWRVYGNVLSLDSPQGTPPEWGDATLLSGDDRSVGWPLTTMWDDGRIAILWNDAEDDPTDPGGANLVGRERVLDMAVPGYGFSLYDHGQGGFLPTSEFSQGGSDLGRVTDLETYGSQNQGLLLISRIDADVAGTTEEEAQVAARLLTIDGSGQVVNPASSTPIVLPGTYDIRLGFRDGLAGQLPTPGEYKSLRNVLAGRGPTVQKINDDRFLVTWSPSPTSAASATDSRIFAALFDSAAGTWAASVVDLLEIASAQNPVGSSNQGVSSVVVDPLGFATVVWWEGANDRRTPDYVRSMRSTFSMLDVDLSVATGPGSLAEAFEGAVPQLIAEKDEDTVTGDVIYPSFPSASRADGSGQFLVNWQPRLVTGGSAFPIGTNARRYD